MERRKRKEKQMKIKGEIKEGKDEKEKEIMEEEDGKKRQEKTKAIKGIESKGK